MIWLFVFLFKIKAIPYKARCIALFGIALNFFIKKTVPSSESEDRTVFLFARLQRIYSILCKL